MKNTQKTIWMIAVSLVIFVLLALPTPSIAQDVNDTEDAQTFTQEQLAQLLAPIALYPDDLIAQVLLASTYPLEIVMADRWVQQNKDLKGDALASALERETWDPSVKSLVNFPSVLSMLSQKLDLTTKLGDAFLEQKDDVMDMIQELRQKAANAGNLKSSREQKVVVEEDEIMIEPTDTNVVYVPMYDPYVVYGPWWYPDYPPYYFYRSPYPGFIYSFGIGVTLGLPWGYAWGGWDWNNYNVIVNVNRHLGYNRYINRSRYIQRYERRGLPIRDGQVSWQHDPYHRRGVAYTDKVTARKFGQLPARSGEVRRESRGFSSPGRSIQGTKNNGAGVGRGTRGVVTPGITERSVRKDVNGSVRITPPKATTPPKVTRESAFSGGNTDGSQTRKFSERGRQSVGGGNVYRGGITTPSSRGLSVGSSRGSSVGSGGNAVPRGGGRGSNNRR